MAMQNVDKNDEESKNINYRLCSLDEVPDWIKCSVDNYIYIYIKCIFFIKNKKEVRKIR